jgi:hypothetical protein
VRQSAEELIHRLPERRRLFDPGPLRYQWRTAPGLLDHAQMASPEHANEPAETRWTRSTAYRDMWVGNSDLGTLGTTEVPLRDVLVHMIEEYARHCGHADLLRERIDGRVGQ